ARRAGGSLAATFGLSIVVAALVLSRSRAAWLAVLAMAVTVGGLAFLTRQRWRDRTTRSRLVLVVSTAALGALAAVLLPNRLEWRSDSPYLDSAAGVVNYKEGSGRGRLVQYTNSLRMLPAHP